MFSSAARNFPSGIRPHVLTTEVDKISHWAKHQSLFMHEYVCQIMTYHVGNHFTWTQLNGFPSDLVRRSSKVVYLLPERLLENRWLVPISLKLFGSQENNPFAVLVTGYSNPRRSISTTSPWGGCNTEAPLHCATVPPFPPLVSLHLRAISDEALWCSTFAGCVGMEFYFLALRRKLSLLWQINVIILFVYHWLHCTPSVRN